MKTTWQTLNTVFLTILSSLLFAMPQMAKAQFTFATNNGTLTIKSYTGSGWNVIIPSVTNGLPVTSIRSSAFWNNSSIRGVAIPSSIIDIGASAFDSCTALTNVTLGDGLVSIGDSAFYNCSGLTNIALVSSLARIGNYSFERCSNLFSMTIPISVTNIGSGPFRACTAMKAINVDAMNPAYCSSNGVLFDKAQLQLLQFPGGLSGDYVIPSSVTRIEASAFYCCTGLTSVIIGNNVTNIGAVSFWYCSGLTNMTFPTSVTSIGGSAFGFCLGLPSVTIPSTVISIGSGPFKGCAAMDAIHVDSFNDYYSSLNGVLFDKAKSLLIQCPGSKAGEYVIPSSVASIGDWGFSSCSNLTSVVMHQGVTNMGNYTFYFCSGLTNLTIPSSITTIGDAAFYACRGLTSVVIPNSVTNISGVAYSDCSRLTNITIGSSVASIGDFAFNNCSKLASVYFDGNAPSVLGIYVFNLAPATIYYLPGKTGWSAWFGNRPAKLWNPMPQTSGPNFGVRTNRFGFNITGTTNIPIAIEATTNLSGGAWVPLKTCTITNGSIYFSDPAWSSFPSRSYRIRSP